MQLEEEMIPPTAIIGRQYLPFLSFSFTVLCFISVIFLGFNSEKKLPFNISRTCSPSLVVKVTLPDLCQRLHWPLIISWTKYQANKSQRGNCWYKVVIRKKILREQHNASFLVSQTTPEIIYLLFFCRIVTLFSTHPVIIGQ